MPVDNRMVILTSKDDNTTAEDATALIASAGANNMLVGELALNSYNGHLYAGADPENASASIGGKVPLAADILGMTLSTVATMQAVGTGASPTFAGLSLSGDTDVGAVELKAETFESDATTGTAPFTVASTTNVANLNASSLSGVASTGFVAVGGDDMTGPLVLDDTSLKFEEGVDTLTITVPTLTASRAWTFPDGAGEIASTATAHAYVEANALTLTSDLTMSGAHIIVPTGYDVQIADAPGSDTDAANKAYVDSVAQGLYIHDAVVAASSAGLDSGYTYANGTSGVGATITADAAGVLTIDGIATDTTGERFLMKNQSTVGENGIYTVTTASAAGAAIVLTRATDFDVVADMKSGAFVFVQQGTANADSGWVVTQDNTITVGSTDPAFTQFSGAGQITAGDGLTKDGNTLDLTDIATGGVLGNTSGSDAAPARVSTPMIGLITAANAGDARTALGTQAVATGGTGATSLTDGGILLGSGTSAVTAMAALADSEMIVGDGTTDPVAESGDTLRISIGVGSTSTFQCTGIELGHATANTLTASSGIMSIEGVAMPTISSTDTLTNKTITAPVLGGTVTGTYTLGGTPTLGTGTVLTLPQVNDTSSNHQYVFAVSELVADRTVTLPLLTGNDTFVFADFIQTLTNKTLSGGTF